MGWSLDACVDQGRLSRRNIQESDDFKETLLVLSLEFSQNPGRRDHVWLSHRD